MELSKEYSFLAMTTGQTCDVNSRPGRTPSFMFDTTEENPCWYRCNENLRYINIIWTVYKIMINYVHLEHIFKYIYILYIYIHRY